LHHFARFRTPPGISKMTFARLLAPELLPSSVQKYLFLDADLLVLDDLQGLWKTCLRSAVLGAVIDGIDASLKTNSPDAARVPRVDTYFNAGVLLVDVPNWKSNRVTEKALDYLSAHPATPYADQDALNVACDRAWRSLPERWNFQSHLRVQLDRLNFITCNKPWLPMSGSANAAFYEAYRARTAFARTRMQKASEAVVRLIERMDNALKHGTWYRRWRTRVRGKYLAKYVAKKAAQP
jgi:lipopolysaccharide biosynthesis glycosyltransferase